MLEAKDNYYPLVNCYITMENHHFFMGKSTISMAIFNSKLLVYQRVAYKMVLFVMNVTRLHDRYIVIHLLFKGECMRIYEPW